jgi:uncharacterized membrane protein SirB2
MSIPFLKYVHIVAVAVAFALFFVRGLWVMRSYPPPQEPWVRRLPYVVDSVLVISALLVLWEKQKLGWPGDWFSVKLLCIAAYAILALAVLKFARGLGTKILAWIGAMGIFLFITTVAVLRHPLGVFSLF